MIVNITKNKLKNSSRKEKQIKQINTRLVEASNCSQEELFLKYQTSQNGFQDEERIEAAREEYGLNKITKKALIMFESVYLDHFLIFLTSFCLHWQLFLWLLI